MPNAAFVNDPNCISDERLDSNLIGVISNVATVTFRNNFNMETGFDGGVLEISINGGAFQDIIAAGGYISAPTGSAARRGARLITECNWRLDL